MKSFVRLLLLVFVNFVAGSGYSQEQKVLTYKDSVEKTIRQKVENDLNQYCHSMCKVVDIDVTLKEILNGMQDPLGFERDETSLQPQWKTEKATVEILVDDRFGSSNLEKLKNIMSSLSKKSPYSLDFRWAVSEFPESPTLYRSQEEIRNQFSHQLTSFLNKNVQDYCPGQCKILQNDISIQKVKAEQLSSFPHNPVTLTPDGNYGLVMMGAQVALALNSSMDNAEKDKIKKLFISETNRFGKVEFDFQEFPFPKTKVEQDQNTQDPYGLERLSALLKTLRENASTKEIYREKETSQINEKSNSLIDKQVSEKNDLRDSTLKSDTSSQLNPMYTYGAIGAIFILLFISIIIYFSNQNKIIKSAIEEANRPHGPPVKHPFYQETSDTVETQSQKNFWKIHSIKSSIIQQIRSNPTQAKRTFNKLLEDLGPYETAKIVQTLDDEALYDIFRKMEPLNSVSKMSQHILELTSPLSPDEQLSLLHVVQNHLTASSLISEPETTPPPGLDFLKNKSPYEILALISDEPPSLQGLVLTQIHGEKRAATFRALPAGKQPEILNYLSQWEALPKKSLHDISTYLQEKSKKIPHFDTHSISGKTIIKDLAQNLTEEEQKRILNLCDVSQPETAGLLRAHLISPRTIEYLPSAVIIDILLSIDQILVGPYLMSLQPRTREAILLRVPRDLRQTWKESLESSPLSPAERDSLTSQAHHAVEEKIRHLVLQKTIDLVAINNRLFPPVSTAQRDENSSLLSHLQKAS